MNRLSGPVFAFFAFTCGAACDAPGGGEPVFVDCGATPEHPLCNPDTSSDTGAFETSDALADATPSDGSDDATVAAQCAGSVRRCAGNLVEVCANGVYVGVEQCSGDRVCVDGFCEFEAECEEGTRRCDSGTAESCDEGQWTLSERCVPELGCGSDRCITAQGGDCFAVYTCMAEAGCDVNDLTSLCARTCLGKADDYSRGAYRQLTTCQTNCGNDFGCQADSCMEQLLGCYRDGTDGSQTCVASVACAMACAAGDLACERRCVNRAGYWEQERTMTVIACRDFYCPSRDASCQSTADESCSFIGECAQGVGR